MHKEILSPSQRELLPLVAKFKDEFCLVGGTAVALHIGHRRSIDFDLFKHGELRHKKILDAVKAHGLPVQVTRRVEEQLNLTVGGVKLTFFDYPFPIPAPHSFENVLVLPDLLTLASMKAWGDGQNGRITSTCISSSRAFIRSRRSSPSPIPFSASFFRKSSSAPS
jgi:hypothetical protein